MVGRNNLGRMIIKMGYALLSTDLQSPAYLFKQKSYLPGPPSDSANPKCDCLPLIDSRHLIKLGIQSVENMFAFLFYFGFVHFVTPQEIVFLSFLPLLYTTFFLKKVKQTNKQSWVKEHLIVKIKTYKGLRLCLLRQTVVATNKESLPCVLRANLPFYD